MAVAVQRHSPVVVLDEHDRIVEVDAAAEGRLGPLVGAVVWDCYPGSEPLFRPYCDEARRTGEPVDFVQFYDGTVMRITALAAPPGRLELSWELLARLDATTIDSLRTSLADALELLDLETSGAQREQLRRALRLIDGGGA